MKDLQEFVAAARDDDIYTMRDLLSTVDMDLNSSDSVSCRIWTILWVYGIIIYELFIFIRILLHIYVFLYINVNS